jgi:hypothetical protein
VRVDEPLDELAIERLRRDRRVPPHLLDGVVVGIVG